VAQTPGLAAPVPVAPFLNGVFPPRAPRDPASVSWDVAPVFRKPSPPPPAPPEYVTFSEPLVIATSPEVGDDRLYVGSRDGNVVSIENLPTVAGSQPFLDLRDRVAVVSDGGLLGMAFHPEFGTPGSPRRGHLYVYYASHCPLDAGGEGVDLAACPATYTTAASGFFGIWLRLSRFTVPNGASVPDPASERVLLNLRLYNGSHRGGGMVFADDGTLWLTIGDQYRFWTAQDVVQTLEGGTLRLAVDVTERPNGTLLCPDGSHVARRVFGLAARPDPPLATVGAPDETSGRLYCIPDDNPWLSPGGAAFEEYATIGNRNPHRLAKDPVTGRLWSGEVGESAREEVNILEPGRNYGWPFREGKIASPFGPPPPTILGELTDPVIDFDRTQAAAIIGGYVYRGTRFPELEGRYLAGDWATGRIWAISLDDATGTATATELANFYPPGNLGTFGQDKDGEVYLASVAGSHPLYALERATAAVPEPPALLSQLGAFASLSTLEPSDVFVPFALNEPFWSDGARKARWIALPNDGTHDTPAEQVAFSPSGDWSFPTGSVLMKHFELPLDETDPALTTRLETRFLVHGEDERWYGVTYRWRPDQGDAELLTTGASADYTVALGGGGSRAQSWAFPSREQCGFCHNAAAGGALGPRTHQLNGDLLYPSTGRTDNQLATWGQLGMLAPAPDPVTLASLPRARAHADPTASLEERARSWLDANCASCHRPGSGNRALFDARLATSLADQGLVYGAVIDALGIPYSYVVTPGSAPLSILWHRAAAVGTPEAMPPLAKGLVDERGVELLSAWIQRVDPDVPRSGVEFEYWEVPGLGALPDFDALGPPLATGTVATFDTAPRQRDQRFAFRFRGVVQIGVAGTYTFYARSHGGSQVFLGGALVVDNDGLHTSPQERSGTVALAAGFHEIEVRYYLNLGDEALTVSLVGPGLAKQLIPPALLFPSVPVPLANEPPALASPGLQTAAQGLPASLALAAGDPDGDDLWFEAQGLPPGLVLDRESGLISGVPTIPGEYAVTVGASDGPAVDAESFEWNVQARPCADGVDNDGDGRVDAPADPGCRNDASPTESPRCQDGLDNDGQAGIDFDGGASLDLDLDGFVDAAFNPATPPVGAADPQCAGLAWKSQEKPQTGSCGLGFELVLALPLLARLRRQRRAAPAAAG
jgi:uncharacterized repeat protein (TIGR03806 family)